ncbi:MAG TPA: fructosamine kinase family protein [Burkholderiales bacterium]|nr:fructosamine kinase family protein [Burkholderiales bacterium]
MRFDRLEPVSGGCIHRSYRALVDGRTRFLKMNDARMSDAFAAEADGLSALRAAGCRAPEPLAHGVKDGEAYLLMEFLDLGPGGDFSALGKLLAALHQARGERFGWARDNYIGATAQQNGWCESWAQFWRERRLGPQLAIARRKGFAIDAARVCDLLDAHAPQPSLVHGDLWSGNVGFLATGRTAAPVLFDPAVYYGDREVDLAMTELFGGFPREFYSAYEAAWPLPPGYETRKHLYNLYHLLNHLNLFGGGYLAQVNSTLGLLARGL